MTKAAVLDWTLLIIPLLMAAASLALAMKKAIANRTRRVKQSYEWEAGCLFMSLLIEAHSARIVVDSEQRRSEQADTITKISDLLAPQLLAGYSQPDRKSIISDVTRMVDAEFPSDSLRVSRAAFRPWPMPGTGIDADRLLSDKFKALAFPMTLLLGYPDEARIHNAAELRDHRSQMERYLFELLTSDFWRDVEESEVYRNKVEIHYLPWERSHDTVVVSTDTKARCALVFYEGRWGSHGNAPTYSAYATTDNAGISRSIGEDHARMRDTAIRYLADQLRQPAYARAPCTIFASSDATDGLRPVSFDVAMQRVVERRSMWEQSGDGPRMPDALIELSRIMATVHR